MPDSKSEASRSKPDDRPLLVVKVKLVRVIVGSLIGCGVIGILLIMYLVGSPTPQGVPDNKVTFAITIAICMIIFSLYFFYARHALRATLTAENLYVRISSWGVRTITIPLRDIRRVSVEKRYVRFRYSGYYRDFLIITYDGNKQVTLRIVAYHPHDLWELLTTLKRLAPHINYDANIRRFLSR